ncbi:hypothetical protein JCM9533A_63510 [Catenuloplanes niger JCM 9533]
MSHDNLLFAPGPPGTTSPGALPATVGHPGHAVRAVRPGRGSGPDIMETVPATPREESADADRSSATCGGGRGADIAKYYMKGEPVDGPVDRPSRPCRPEAK